jgi:uncharacterized protein YcfJ
VFGILKYKLGVLKMKNRIMMLVIILLASLIFVSGCASDAGTGTLLGSAAGAGIGYAIGGDATGALIGAGVGGVGGYMLGNESDKGKEKKATNQQIGALQAEQNSETIWITNSNGSKVPVKLRKDGPNFIGPRGEIYQSRPTEDQLKTVYGF